MKAASSRTRPRTLSEIGQCKTTRKLFYVTNMKDTFRLVQVELYTADVPVIMFHSLVQLTVSNFTLFTLTLSVRLSE